jgi:hypothetical protein
MGALLNPLPSERKQPAKAARPAKLNQYRRDPQWPSERLRASSDYDADKGYAPLFHGFLADLPRLTSGNSCTLLILTLLSKSLGRGAAKGQPRPDWTLALSVEDLAQICRCDVRTIEREVAALDKRGLAEVRRPGKGEIEARLKFRDWESLPDYKSAVVKMEPSEDAVPDPETVDESKPGNQRVTGRKPVRLAAGALSKAFPVSCGVRTFRHKAEGPVDLEFSCVIQAGELLVVSRFPEDWREKVENSIPRSNGINENTLVPRHGCREESKVSPAKVTHPRAAELVELFDPILARSGSRLLSGDSSSLRAACEAVGDCDHHYLVKIAVERAERRVKSPLDVRLICSDASASWKTSKVLTGAGLPDVASPEEIKALIAKERAARLAKKR